jgi:adenylate cyclase
MSTKSDPVIPGPPYGPKNVSDVWWYWFTTSAFQVDNRLRRIFRLLPRDPRCKFCNAPFRGIGGTFVRVVFGKRQSVLNPHYCNICDEMMHKFPGGAEVDMAMLFADVRGSTALSTQMSATQFSRFINRFYTEATKIIIEEDGLVEKLAGDQVAAYWGAGFAGPDYIQRTLKAARRLSRHMSRLKIPVGIGVHAGLAYFGAVGNPDGLTDISAIGDEVNVAARLTSQAGEGEIVVSEQALKLAGMDGGQMETRRLDLKGIAKPVAVRIMHGS